jgi:predicted aspartyl protease
MRPQLLFLLGVALLAQPPARQARALFDAEDWFGLRDAIGTGGAKLHQGAVAVAFGDWPRAEILLREVIQSAPKSKEAAAAHQFLITVAQLRGDWAAAVAEIRRLKAIRPKADGVDNADALFGSLAAFPPQAVVARRPSSVRYEIHDGTLFVPVRVNGQEANYLFDTGANFSAISESEARRLGLKMARESDAHGFDAAGKRIGARAAVAETLTLGDFELRNVAFLVVGDTNQPFVDLPQASRGVVGIPVAMAFETVRWTPDGRFEVGFPTAPSGAGSNLCLNGANPHFLATFEGKPVTFFYDSGASNTRLMPAFARAFPRVAAAGKPLMDVVSGVGGSSKVRSVELPRVDFVVAGRTVTLAPLKLLRELPGGRNLRYHGWAGLDFFQRDRTLTLDFRVMRVSLD